MAKGVEQKGSPPPNEGTPAVNHYDQMHVMSMLVEIQKDITAHSTKLDRLITDHKEVSDELSDVKSSVNRHSAMVTGGFAVLCLALIVIWYLIGDDFKALLDYAHSLKK